MRAARSSVHLAGLAAYGKGLELAMPGADGDLFDALTDSRFAKLKLYESTIAAIRERKDDEGMNRS